MSSSLWWRWFFKDAIGDRSRDCVTNSKKNKNEKGWWTYYTVFFGYSLCTSICKSSPLAHFNARGVYRIIPCWFDSHQKMKWLYQSSNSITTIIIIFFVEHFVFELNDIRLRIVHDTMSRKLQLISTDLCQFGYGWWDVFGNDAVCDPHQTTYTPRTRHSLCHHPLLLIPPALWAEVV